MQDLQNFSEATVPTPIFPAKMTVVNPTVLMFVPYSVQMRARGYLRDGRTWVPAVTKQARETRRAATKAAIANRMARIEALRSIPRANWYTIVRAEEEAREAHFSALSEASWCAWRQAEVLSWKTAAERAMGVVFIDRIHDLRKAVPATTPAPSPAPSALCALIRERRGYIEDPQAWGFASPAEQQAAIYRITATILASSGRWRISSVFAEEAEQNAESVRAIQTAWRTAVQRRAVRALAVKFGIF